MWSILACLTLYVSCYSVTAIKILILTGLLKWIIGFFPNEDHLSYYFLSEGMTFLALFSQYCFIAISGILNV